MKYIRTKDGIYKTMFENEELLMCFDHTTIEPAYYSVDHEWIAKRDVIKEADTVEELCDEYVVKHINSMTPMLIDKFTISLKEIKTQYSGNDNFEYIYGAIWVIDSNGAPTLKPAAKMNKKGDLELL